MEKVLYIVRGVPGSGKTTLAKQLTANVFEADHYFYDNDGNYNFIPSEIKEAHKECQQFVGYAMESGIQKIAVSNTFTQEWEMKPYFELAEKYGGVRTTSEAAEELMDGARKARIRYDNQVDSLYREVDEFIPDNLVSNADNTVEFINKYLAQSTTATGADTVNPALRS